MVTERAKSRTDWQDNERIFSGDLWCKSQAVEMYSNLLGTLKEDVDGRDWWKFPVTVLRRSEVFTLQTTIFPPLQRARTIAGERLRRHPPAVENGDSCLEVLDYLYKNRLCRFRLLELLLPLLKNRQAELQALMKKIGKKSPLEKRFHEMQELFNLSDLECQLILFLFLSQNRFWDLSPVYRSRYGREFLRTSALAKALNVSESQISVLLQAKGNLRRFGLLEAGSLDLDDDFQEFLNGISDTPLCDRFYTRFNGEVLPWKMHGKLAEEEGAVLSDMIRARQPGQGQNILLYGLAGTGKTAFAQSLAKELGKELYFINQAGSPESYGRSSGPSFRYAGLEVANLRLNPEKVIVCVDECDKMLSNVGFGAFFSLMIGVPADRDGEGKGQLNAVLDNLKLTVIWIANSHRDSIDPSSRRRFDYNVYFDSLSPVARCNIWENALQRYGMSGQLSPEFIETASHRYPVNAGGISVAVKNAAAVVQHQPEADFTEATMTYLRSHCNILNIVDNLDGCKPARDYTLQGLNLKTGPGLERIIAACKTYLKSCEQPGSSADSPRLNLLLFGPPGTGKTEFVKYLAQQLGKPLSVKMASDMLNKYLGGTEERIVNAFREAAAEKSILFIDEGDAMLNTRSKAVHSWETSQVVTLLNQMENFAGIFIMATNFAQNLDPAASRRFTFKLRFDYLDLNGKLQFYKNFFEHLKLPPLEAQEQMKLDAIAQLTPGDFRNVRQQFFYLTAETLNNAEIIKALDDEVSNKNQQSLSLEFNQQNKIGFDLLKNIAGGE